MSLTKQQLQVLNTTNFPNNTTGYITPELLREFNSQSVDSMALQTDLDTLSGSVSTQLNNLNNFSSSLVANFATVAQLNNSSSTLQAEINTLAGTASVNTLSQSVFVQFDAQTQTNTAVTNRFNTDEAAFNSYTQSNNLAVAGKAVLVGNNTFTGSQTITGNVTILGNIAAANFTQSWTSSLVSQTQFGNYTASISTSLWQLYTSSSTNSSSIGSLITDSASFDTRIDSLEAWSASLDATFATDAQLNASSSTLQSNINTKLDTSSFNTFSTSVDSRLDSLEAFSSSLDATFATDAQLNASSSTLQANIDTKLNTSSFNTFSTSVDSRLDSIEGAGYVTAAVTASSLVTASFSSQTLTFTKGDGSQFSLAIPDVSGSTINTGSLLVTASASGNTITFTKGDSSTFNVTVSGSTIDTSSFITTGDLNGTQFISGTLVFTGSARIQLSTASIFNYGGGNQYLNLQYEPSASAITYSEVNTALPQYINQAVKVGAITSGSIVGGFVKILPNPSLVATGTTGSINEIGILSVSQSSTDYREWFGYNGNPQNDGEKAFLVQRGLHKVAGNGLGFSVANAASYSVGTPIYWDNINSTGAMTVVRPTSGQVLRLGYIAGIQDDPANPYVREMWYDPFWEEGQTFYNAKLSGSVTLTNSNLVTTSSLSSYATTGSNTFTGNQTINANLYVSSSNTSDVVVNGQVFISSSATGGTTAPKLTVSGSAGQSIINRNSISTRNATYQHNVQPAFVDLSSLSTADAIGLTIDTTSAGATGWTAGGAIYVNNVAGDTYPAAIGFQNKANYTDGRVTVLKPLIVSGSTTMSGSLTIQSGSGDFYIYGHKMFNAGEFWSTTTQSGSAGVSGSITFNNSGSVSGVTLANNSQLTVTNAGTYNIQFSAQIETSAGADTAYLWFKKNGTNISDSATKVVLANNTAQVMTVNILDEAAANDYYELGYQFTNGNATILSEAASGNIPAIPSVIATITQAR